MAIHPNLLPFSPSAAVIPGERRFPTLLPHPCGCSQCQRMSVRQPAPPVAVIVSGSRHPISAICRAQPASAAATPARPLSRFLLDRCSIRFIALSHCPSHCQARRHPRLTPWIQTDLPFPLRSAFTRLPAMAQPVAVTTTFTIEGDAIVMTIRRSPIPPTRHADGRREGHRRFRCGVTAAAAMV